MSNQSESIQHIRSDFSNWIGSAKLAILIFFIHRFKGQIQQFKEKIKLTKILLNLYSKKKI